MATKKKELFLRLPLIDSKTLNLIIFRFSELSEPGGVPATTAEASQSTKASRKQQQQQQ